MLYVLSSVDSRMEFSNTFVIIPIVYNVLSSVDSRVHLSYSILLFYDSRLRMILDLKLFKMYTECLNATQKCLAPCF